MIVGAIFIAVLSLNILLVYLTAKDARSRGHSGFLWGLLTFVFGLFAILIYLLTRNDHRLPKEERPKKYNWGKFGIYALYIFIIITLTFSMASVGGELSKIIYPMPEGDTCLEETEVRGRMTCTDNNEELINEQVRVFEKRDNLRSLFAVLGFIGSSISIGVFETRTRR